jgi:hypothetical protein
MIRGSLQPEQLAEVRHELRLAQDWHNLPQGAGDAPALGSISTSLQQRLFKTGERLLRHARYFIL